MIPVQTVEELICEQAGRKHCVLVGHGSTAVYLALKLIEMRSGPGEVILPTISCTSLAQVTHYAGFKPVFADVNPEDFTLDIRSFESRINEQTRAVMPIHIFGHSAAMDEITRISSERGLFVLEDAAQSLGGTYRGQAHGSFGDFSIFSFGGTKIISAGGGGALLFDDDEYLAPITRELERLPPLRLSPRQSLMALSHRNFYHALVDLLRVNPEVEVSHLFNEALPHYRELYFHRFPEDECVLNNIATGFAHLRENVALRFERASLYYDLLSSEHLTHSKSWQESRVVWRYTFLVNDPQKLLRVTQQLRRQGIHASNHYWSVADLFYGAKDLPNTSHFCPRVLNLWVDQNATTEYISRSCDIILKELD
jgi:dTDP-4-amino-4,6-dideoxygalactose transaminase